MDFLVCITIISDKSAEELTEYFEARSFKNVYYAHPHKAEVDVKLFEDGQFETKFLRDKAVPIKSNLYDKESSYYLIALCGSGYGAWFDIRGG